MRAEDVGWATNRMVLGKHSGRHAFQDRMKELGFELESDDGTLQVAFDKFKELADRKHEIFDDDLIGLHAQVTSGVQESNDKLELESLQVWLEDRRNTDGETVA